MDKNYAIKLIQDVFQNPFNRDRFVTFTKNLFNFLDTGKNFIYRGNFIPDAYKPYINTLERIGKYEDVEENKIDVLIVHLKKEHSIEHARTMQRNFIAWYLGGSRGGELKDAALVAFHTDNPDDWRFSLVKMDYQIVESGAGKIKTKTELTPARRFSFLVGKNENSHTAQRQLLPTLQDDKNNPLLSDLEKAFNIEVVTQEFFEKYKSLFLDVKDSLDRLMKKDQAIAKDFTDKGVDPVDFSKKLLGQIVFLYFLQKKGWFGVERDSDWGTGPKNFLRLLFEKMIANYKNFFNDILEPLFYEALAKERDDDFYSRFNCKIPFLNGGLFDPLSDYDWVHTDILLPDELFSNLVRTKEGDTGTGILDIFDRYNFTVKEDEPLEKEVAVDPEMLGKVFENLLEVKDRKSKGTYYTPREIVHYMCQESLINYLVNECEGKVGRKDIETLIQYGETAVEHDSRVEQEGKETETYSYKLPESIRKNAQLLDDKLKNISVCDPAIGSGAFPVGMMNEIIRTRNTLTNYLEDKKDRSIYNFKRDAIQNSLYGVDIDPCAVEIAKLRLWLSLVVVEGGIKQIKPLPNLDYKIMQGNSLLEVEKEKMGMRDMFYEQKMQELKEKKQYLFNETSTSKKHEYKEQIDELINQLTNGHKDFDFEVYFSEVFEEKGGFDLVIANPPYVYHKKLNTISGQLKKLYNTYSGTSDLYVYFYEQGINILKNKGILTYISSNKFIRTSYGEKLRGLLSSLAIQHIIDFTKVRVFDALVASCVLIVLKDHPSEEVSVTNVNDEIINQTSLADYIEKNHQKISLENFGSDIWQLEDNKKLKVKGKIELGSRKLSAIKGINIYRGITTGYNSAFIINEDIKIELIKADKKNAEIIKPLLQGRNIKKWFYISSNRYLLQTGFDRNVKLDFPPLYHYLSNYEKELKKRDDQGKNWWNLRACKYYTDFEKEKIIWGLTADKWAFAYDVEKNYLPSNGYILTTESKHSIKYLLALLNSRLLKFYFGFIGIMTAGGAYTLKHETISALPIKEVSESEQKPFMEIVDKILAITSSSDYLANSEKQAKVKDYEKQIDQLVYQLYDLTPEE